MTITRSDNLKYYPLPDIDGELIVSDHISDITSLWSKLSTQNVFFQEDFFKALESSPPSGLRYKYVIIKKNNEVIAAYYFQYKKIKLDESLSTKNDVSGWEYIVDSAKSMAARMFRANILICGNLALTGLHGIKYRSEENEKALLLETAITKITDVLREENIIIRGVLVKDFHERNLIPLSQDYQCFTVQPNMVLHLREWSTLDYYLADLKSKYRTRYKRARKKLAPVTKRVLDIEELKLYADRMHELYQNVVDNADFNLFILPIDYFHNLQLHLQDRLVVIGYFHEDQLVGFSTYIHNGDNADAHFLGYDVTVNEEHQLYLNMLYDLLEIAIEHKAQRLYLSRTAMAIKSSIGAEPMTMYLYMKATNQCLAPLMPYVTSYFKPDPNWTPRSPFKD